MNRKSWNVPSLFAADLLKASFVSALLGILLSTSSAKAAVPVSFPKTTGQTDWSLHTRFYTESAFHLLQRSQWTLSRFVSGGLQYATTKLCDNELRVELEDLNRQVVDKLSHISKSLGQNQGSRNEVSRHLAAAKKHSFSNPLLSNMEMDLAKIELARLVELNRSSGKLIQGMASQLIKSEILYQRVLAECLLNDFKSIFGSGRSPAPIPDDWPLNEELEERPEDDYEPLEL